MGSMVGRQSPITESTQNIHISHQFQLSIQCRNQFLSNRRNRIALFVSHIPIKNTCRTRSHIPNQYRHHKQTCILQQNTGKPLLHPHPLDTPKSQGQKESNHCQKINNILRTNQTISKIPRLFGKRQPVSNILHNRYIAPHFTDKTQKRKHRQRPDSCHHLIRRQSRHKQPHCRISTNQQIKTQEIRKQITIIHIFNHTGGKHHIRHKHPQHKQTEQHHRQILSPYNLKIRYRRRKQQFNRATAIFPAHQPHCQQRNIKIKIPPYIGKPVPEKLRRQTIPRITQGLVLNRTYQYSAKLNSELYRKNKQYQPRHRRTE